MATADEIALVRRLANYTGDDPYDDAALSALIDAASTNRVIEQLWAEKAASYSSLVNVSESGSSRSLGDAYKNALVMAKHYGGLADTEENVVDNRRVAFSRPIVREGS